MVIIEKIKKSSDLAHKMRNGQRPAWVSQLTIRDTVFILKHCGALRKPLEDVM